MRHNAGPRSPVPVCLTAVVCGLAACGMLHSGCQSAKPHVATRLADDGSWASDPLRVSTHPEGPSSAQPAVELTSFASNEDDPQPTTSSETESSKVDEPVENAQQNDHSSEGDLRSLENLVVSENPELRRLSQETAAAWAKVRYIDELPDPTLGFNAFGHPIETAAGSQRGNLSVMQMIPWLKRLDAQAQQACFEAMAMQQMYEVERLKALGDLRANWAKLYVLGQQISIVEANRELLLSLSELVNARIGQNIGSTGDLTLITVEIARLEEQLLVARQQVASTTADINRLAGRSADASVAVPSSLSVIRPDWSHETLRQTAWEYQPAIAAAELRVQASRWGVEIARLKQRPDVSFSASWFAIDDNRPTSRVVDIGRDAWSMGAQVTLPLWGEKYTAMQDEATWKHFSAHASVEEARLRYDALLRDLLEQAKAADETAKLYESTIIPQAEQTLQADQQALANGTVDLDRVIQDVRSLLTLQLNHHRALGQLATANARIRQAVGVDLESNSPIVPPTPLAPAP